MALAAFFYAGWIVCKTLMFAEPVRGYPSLMVVVSFLGGVQLSFIGILGEYLGRMFNEVKRRPLYFLNAYEPGSASKEAAIVATAIRDKRVPYETAVKVGQ